MHTGHSADASPNAPRTGFNILDDPGMQSIRAAQEAQLLRQQRKGAVYPFFQRVLSRLFRNRETEGYTLDALGQVVEYITSTTPQPVVEASAGIVVDSEHASSPTTGQLQPGAIPPEDPATTYMRGVLAQGSNDIEVPGHNDQQE